jgi:hypothetical protein
MEHNSWKSRDKLDFTLNYGGNRHNNFISGILISASEKYATVSLKLVKSYLVLFINL